MTKPASLFESAQYQELFEEAPIAYHELDADGVVQRVNHAERELLGYTQSEMVGRPIWDFVAGEDLAACRAALARKIAGTQPLVPFRRLYVTRDGTYVTVQIYDRLIRDGQNRVIGMRSALLNVSEQVAAEAALATSELWLASMLRSVVSAVIAIDSLGRVKIMNPAAERLTGYRQAEGMGLDIEDILVLSDLQSELGESTLEAHFCKAAESTWCGTSTVRHRGGECRRAAIKGSPIINDEGVIMGWAIILNP